MGTLAVHWGWLDTVLGFPDRLRENPPRQGFFEHPEYLAVRAHLPAPWQDILDLAYYSGWRKNEILGLTWDEIDEAGGPISPPPSPTRWTDGGHAVAHRLSGGRRADPLPPRLPPPRRPAAALLHESSLARTMPTDRILTCRCDTTLVGRGRSSD